MPLYTLHLLALHPSTSPSSPSADPLPPFLSALRATPLTPLLTARVIRWIILPTTFSTDSLLALNRSWSLLLILPSAQTFPPSLQALISAHWSVTAGIPSRLTEGFRERNGRLLNMGTEEGANVPSPKKEEEGKEANEGEKRTTPSSSQNLELSPDLSAWISTFSQSTDPGATAPVSMFNLLSFLPGKKSSYLEYGRAFSSSVGKAHGGVAKLVGGVVEVDGVRRGEKDGEGWDEVAVAQYPSLGKFAEMLGDEGYQGVNRRWRLPSLRDTAILMTSEVGLGEGKVGLEGGREGKARL